jgi:hypothetical protein
MEWKNITNEYQISNTGHVKSLKWNKEKILKPYPNNTGYLQINLRIYGKRKVYLMHRLVAEYFIPNPENKPCINHIDNNPKNNSIENLEWCTQYENMQHCIKQGRKKCLEDTRKKMSIKKLKKIQCIDLQTKETQIFDSIMEASKVLNIKRDSIYTSHKKGFTVKKRYKFKLLESK